MVAEEGGIIGLGAGVYEPQDCFTHPCGFVSDVVALQVVVDDFVLLLIDKAGQTFVALCRGRGSLYDFFHVSWLFAQRYVTLAAFMPRCHAHLAV